MKLTQFANLLIFAAVLAVASGCKTKPQGVTTIPGSPAGAPDEFGKGKPIDPNGLNDGKISGTDTGIPANSPDSHKGWPQNTEIFKADTVHFDFDSSAIKEGEKPHVAAVADYLKANSGDAVLIQGYCDERGTPGYNMALGDRRSQALREEMVRLGIAATRVDTVSYGAEHPVAEGHDESAYRQNRRGVFVLLTPPK